MRAFKWHLSATHFLSKPLFRIFQNHWEIHHKSWPLTSPTRSFENRLLIDSDRRRQWQESPKHFSGQPTTTLQPYCHDHGRPWSPRIVAGYRGPEWHYGVFGVKWCVAVDIGSTKLLFRFGVAPSVRAKFQGPPSKFLFSWCVHYCGCNLFGVKVFLKACFPPLQQRKRKVKGSLTKPNLGIWHWHLPWLVLIRVLGIPTM